MNYIDTASIRKQQSPHHRPHRPRSESPKSSGEIFPFSVLEYRSCRDINFFLFRFPTRGWRCGRFMLAIWNLESRRGRSPMSLGFMETSGGNDACSPTPSLCCCCCLNLLNFWKFKIEIFKGRKMQFFFFHLSAFCSSFHGYGVKN